MDKKDDSFVFYRSYWETIEQFENPEEKYKGYKIIFDYVFSGKAPEDFKNLSLCERVAFSSCKSTIDAELKAARSSWWDDVLEV